MLMAIVSFASIAERADTSPAQPDLLRRSASTCSIMGSSGQLCFDFEQYGGQFDPVHADCYQPSSK